MIMCTRMEVSDVELSSSSAIVILFFSACPLSSTSQMHRLSNTRESTCQIKSVIFTISSIVAWLTIPAKYGATVISTESFFMAWLTVLAKYHVKADISKLEMVQCKAARFVFNNLSTYSSVSSMLPKLNWQSLEERRTRAILIMIWSRGIT